MNPLSTASALTALTCVVIAVFATCGHAADFTVKSGETVTTTQTLTSNETGVIEKGGSIEAQSGEDGVEVIGNDNTAINNGSIETMGNFADGIHLSNSNTNTVINNGSIETRDTNGQGISLSVSRFV